MESRASVVVVRGLPYCSGLVKSMGPSMLGLQSLGHVSSCVLTAPGLQSTGSIVVVRGLSCSAACKIFPDQGSDPSLLHWQADSLPLSHQGSPCLYF